MQLVEVGDRESRSEQRLVPCAGAGLHVSELGLSASEKFDPVRSGFENRIPCTFRAREPDEPGLEARNLVLRWRG